MLVLTRKTDQKIQIGENITITVIRVKGQSVRIGIDAPQQVRVMRTELTAGEPKHSEQSIVASQASLNVPVKSMASKEHAAEAPVPGSSSASQDSSPQEGPSCRPLVSRLCRTPGASRATVIRRPQRLGPASLRSMAGRF